MSIIKKIKDRLTTPKPIREHHRPSFAMTSSLRYNAEGLEAHYGQAQFIERIRAAADIIDEMETALMAIAVSSNDRTAIGLANDTLDQCANLKM